MSAALQPISVEEFLAWEAGQAERFEFDGTQPVAMTGGTYAHARLISQLIVALAGRLPRGCRALPTDLKVVTETRVRYPDVTVVCGPVGRADTQVQPSVVFEVLSPSTSLIDRRVKPLDYAAVPSVQAYVILDQDGPGAVVMRRVRGWLEECVAGEEAVLALPEIGVELPLGELYAD